MTTTRESLEQTIARVVGAKLAAIARNAGLPTAHPQAAHALAGLVDHTLLKPEATPEDVAALCAEAIEYHCAAVCVNPTYVTAARSLLRGSGISVCAAIGYPLGATTAAAKLFEARRALDDGARELEVVLATGRLKGGDIRYVTEELEQITRACHEVSARCKVVVEAGLLNEDEKEQVCSIIEQLAIDMVVVSSGFDGYMADERNVVWMRRRLRPGVAVKASGGIDSLAAARRMLEAGATRLGTPATVALMKEATS